MPVPQENRLAGQEMATLVVRSVGGRHREIARALESVGRSIYRPLEVVLVYQGTDEGYLEYLRGLGTLVPSIEYRVAHNPTNEDQRARNLNLGIAVAKGRYVGFLDDDDALEPDHLERLVTVLQDTGRTWAYAQTVLKKENEQFEVIQETTPFVRKSFSLKALWTENFIPIHSFLIDRTRLHDELREEPFNEALTRSEDWDFLIRLGFYHEPAVIEAFTCSYYVSTAPRNSNLSLTRPKTQTEQDLQNKRMWDRSKEIVEGTKEGLLSRFYWARDYFVTAVAPLAAPSAEAPRATKNRLYRRVVLGIIRRLERTV
ncbi:glycosyltransferase family 2 protein [Cupriavidus sp. SK-4]|uniref:glycosyltransferase family 2 protein n=1 Tax=Cupriavidus sp. SK-4 TaxID=574750 RepID=UPI001378FD7D|nr:glycosyltransferase family 2 protein [Cupriavidus sp. SK-4]